MLIEQVRFRFSVPADRLATRVMQIAERAEQDPITMARRLRLDDLYLATSCAEGDAAAWSECDAAHFPFIRDFARRFLPDAAARDLADEVIADLWRLGKIALFEGRSSLRTWLGTVVAHSALNAIKATRPIEPLDDTGDDGVREPAVRLAAPCDSFEDQHSRLALTSLIRGALARLSAEDKLLLQLYYEQGLTLEQMHVAVLASKATVSRRLKRLRDQVRLSVEQEATGRFGLSVERLREGLDLGRLELDLAEILRSAGPEENPRGAV